MDNDYKKQIERENHREARRRMGAGDWSLILGAAVLVAAVLGYIYYSDEAGIDPATRVEPAAGISSQPYNATDTEIPDRTGATDETPPADDRPLP
ncbi:MAG: hypothetical protein WBK55_06575 [Alphaproteobacteria bacterium]